MTVVTIGRDISEYKVGMTESYTRTFTADDIDQFAAVTKDYNYFHVNEQAANNSMFGQRIIHGFLVAAMVTHMGGGNFPGPGLIAYDVRFQFRKPVYIGDTVTCTVTVADVKERRNKVMLDVEWHNQDGVKVLTGIAVGQPTKVEYETE